MSTTTVSLPRRFNTRNQQKDSLFDSNIETKLLSLELNIKYYLAYVIIKIWY